MRNSKKDQNLFHNGDGVLDLTAGKALRNIRIQQTREEAVKLLAKLREIALAEGWTFHGDLTFTNTRTKFYAELRNL